MEYKDVIKTNYLKTYYNYSDVLFLWLNYLYVFAD